MPSPLGIEGAEALRGVVPWEITSQSTTFGKNWHGSHSARKFSHEQVVAK